MAVRLLTGRRVTRVEYELSVFTESFTLRNSPVLRENQPASKSVAVVVFAAMGRVWVARGGGVAGVVGGRCCVTGGVPGGAPPRHVVARWLPPQIFLHALQRTSPTPSMYRPSRSSCVTGRMCGAGRARRVWRC